ncbi:hypothetical protein BDEG_25764 [Batrachochytrium dendrobatidis JEL423]|uniref:Ubiquitin-like protein ATG12 n=1 Tax=Batrachochytrium dendrobatidis (strain JEL423) TaxID=403673 RepID=A0A177WRL5_BATDL|nr:hypothetical protein BDEG_25764 [Batrachochytrium dendrobatidis JEL423]
MESSPPSQKLSQKLSHKLSPLQSESNTEKYSNEVPDKVVVRLKATGSAPILKQTVFKISSSSKFQNVIAFLRKELAYKQGTMVSSSGCIARININSFSG